MGFKLCLLLLLGITVSHVTSNVIASDGSKAVDQDRVDEWVRGFYDKCGETEVVDAENSGGSLCNSGSAGVGPYCSKELVKRCVGDREGCIEEKNCYFALAITEFAYYDAPIAPTSAPVTPPVSTTTFIPSFDKYSRRVEKFTVTVLDTCHINPTANDDKAVLPDKFVGVGLGVFNGTGALDCEAEPTFDDFRAYFLLSNFAACDIKPDLPLYPYIEGVGTPASPLNQFDVVVSAWKARCRSAKPLIPVAAAVDLKSKHSNFMKHLLIHYYGTRNYTKVNDYAYADNANFLEQKGNLYLAPTSSKRNSGSIFSASFYIIVPVVLNTIKSMSF